MRRAGTPLKDLDLSEQQIVDCGYNGKDMNGCNGAQLGAYQKFLAFSGKNVSHEVLDRDPMELKSLEPSRTMDVTKIN